MKIDSLKDLERLIKLLRKTGVYTFELDSMKLELGTDPKPVKQQRFIEDPMEAIAVPTPNIQDPIAAARASAAEELKKIQDYIQNDDVPTEEDLLNWSVPNQVGQQ